MRAGLRFLAVLLALANLAACSKQETAQAQPPSEWEATRRPIADAKDPGPVAKDPEGEALPCKDGGDTTFERNFCSSHELEKAEFELKTYLAAARQTIVEDSKDSSNQGPNPEFDTKRALASFDQAQIAWEQFVRGKCDAAFSFYAHGTIFPELFARCYQRETKLRTLGVWKDWLTYYDSSPPRLPRPEFDPALIGQSGDIH